jgi:hypothetical protein
VAPGGRDAAALPDASFDAVVCQFGAMFFPDKAEGVRGVRRVLRPGACSVQRLDRIADNEVADEVTNGSRWCSRRSASLHGAGPHGYHDTAAVARDLAAAASPRRPRSTRSPRAAGPRRPGSGVAYCQGTPLRNEIEAATPPPRRSHGVAEQASRAASATARVDGKMQAHVVVVAR